MAGASWWSTSGDPQANLARDLGYAAGDGSNLSLAITHGLPIEVTKGGRSPPVIRPARVCWTIRRPTSPATGYGPATALWDPLPAFWLASRRPGAVGRPPHTPLHPAGLKPALDKVGPADGADYDVVLVDTPPGEPILQELVFAAADFLIIPTRSDEASLDGLVVVAQRFAAARAVNPGLTLLGVVLFGVRAGSTRMIARVRGALAETLGDAAPVFATSIRYLESAAVDMRSRGLLPHELAQVHRTDTRKRLSRLRAGTSADTTDSLLSRDTSAAGLAADYAALADEVLAAIKAHGGGKRRLGVAV